MKITRFEDIEAWQESRKLVISKSSVAEIQSHLYVALDQKYLNQEDFETIYSQAEKVSKMESDFIKYLNSQLKQPKQPNKPK